MTGNEISTMFSQMDIIAKTEQVTTDFLEENYSNSRKNLERMKEELRKLKQLGSVEFKPLSEEEIKRIFFEIASEIYGDSVTAEQLEIFYSLINTVDNANILSSYYVKAYDQNYDLMFERVDIPLMNCTGAVVSIGHESVHYFSDPLHFKNNVYKNFHHREILSIVIEKIIAKKLEERLLEENAVRKFNTIRVEDIREQVLNLDDVMKMIKGLTLDKDTKDSVLFGKHIFHSYLVGYLMSTYLYECYLRNNEEFIAMFRKVINGEMDLYGLLDYYHIDFKTKFLGNNAVSEMKNTI